MENLNEEGKTIILTEVEYMPFIEQGYMLVDPVQLLKNWEFFEKLLTKENFPQRKEQFYKGMWSYKKRLFKALEQHNGNRFLYRRGKKDETIYQGLSNYKNMDFVHVVGSCQGSLLREKALKQIAVEGLVPDMASIEERDMWIAQRLLENKVTDAEFENDGDTVTYVNHTWLFYDNCGVFDIQTDSTDRDGFARTYGSHVVAGEILRFSEEPVFDEAVIKKAAEKILEKISTYLGEKEWKSKIGVRYSKWGGVTFWFPNCLGGMADFDFPIKPFDNCLQEAFKLAKEKGIKTFYGKDKWGIYSYDFIYNSSSITS